MHVNDNLADARHVIVEIAVVCRDSPRGVSRASGEAQAEGGGAKTGRYYKTCRVM